MESLEPYENSGAENKNSTKEGVVQKGVLKKTDTAVELLVTSDSNVADTSKTTKNHGMDVEVQTNIAVFPHVLDVKELASVVEEISVQTSITFLPNESLSNVVPNLKARLIHKSQDDEPDSSVTNVDETKDVDSKLEQPTSKKGGEKKIKHFPHTSLLINSRSPVPSGPDNVLVIQPMKESDQIEKVDVGVQSLLHCYEDNQHNVNVSSTRGVQTVISSLPLTLDDSIFIGLLGFIPYSEISSESEKIIVLPRKKKLHWAQPDTMDLNSSDAGSTRSILKITKPEPARTDQEAQTIIAVYPHVLDDGDVAHVMRDVMCQTSITALPDESITNIVPILKQQLPHSAEQTVPRSALKTSNTEVTNPNTGEESVTDPQDSKNGPEDSNDPNYSDHSDNLSPEGVDVTDNLNAPEDLKVTEEDSNVTEDLNSSENLKQTDDPIRNIKSTEEEQPSTILNESEQNNLPEDLKETPVVSEKSNSCSKWDEKVIQKDECFENKVRGILQLAAEVFETEICEFFEEHAGEKKVALCKELVSLARTPKDLDKTAAEDGANEDIVFPTKSNVNKENIIRPNDVPLMNNSEKCSCQKLKNVAFQEKRPSKIPRLVQCCGKTTKFCDNQQSSKIPVPQKKRLKVSKQIHPCIISSGPGDYKEITFNLSSPQLFPKLKSKRQYNLHHQLPTAMKRSIQVGVGQCCSTRDGIEVEEVSFPEPLHDFVYEYDTGYVESYLRTLGNEIKGCQTERTELGEGDWDWEDDEEEEDPCLCDPWKKIAIPLPGTYVLKKTKKLSVNEEKNETDSSSVSKVASTKLPTLELVKLPVYDPKYYKMTELYMESLYDLYPTDPQAEDVCGPETEMPWEDIILPEKCRIKKANPTICTCPGRKQFTVYSSNKNCKETNTKTCSFEPDSNEIINISAKATTKGKLSTVVIHIKPSNDDDSNSYDSDSTDDDCLKELPFYGTPKYNNDTCGCPKWQPLTDTEGKLPSKSPRSVLEMKSKKKTLDLPSNPPKGLHEIIKRVCTRTTFQESGCETETKSTEATKCDQATEAISTSKFDKCCYKIPRQKPECGCKEARRNKKTKEISTCTSKTITRQRAGANGITKNTVGCGSGICAAERDKHHDSETKAKTISFSSKETSTDCERNVPKIRTTISLKRIGHPHERICKEIPMKNEVYELYSKGQTKVILGVNKAIQDTEKDPCLFKSKSKDNNERETEKVSSNQKPSPSSQEGACSSLKPQRKYPVVAALNAFEEEMKPLRAALCQLQKRIYSLDLPEMQSRQSIPKPTVDTAVLAKGPSTASGLQSSTTNMSTATDRFLCSWDSEVDTLMNSSTTTCFTNDSEVSDD